MIKFHNNHSNCTSERRWIWFEKFYIDILTQYTAILSGTVNKREGYDYIIKMFNCLINKNSNYPSKDETKLIQAQLNSMNSYFAKESRLGKNKMTELKKIYDKCVLQLSNVQKPHTDHKKHNTHHSNPPGWEDGYYKSDTWTNTQTNNHTNIAPGWEDGYYKSDPWNQNYLESMKTYTPLHRSSKDVQTIYYNISSDIKKMCSESFKRDKDWYDTMFDIIKHLQELFKASGNIYNRKLFMKAIVKAYSCMVNHDTKDPFHSKYIEFVLYKLSSPYFKKISGFSEEEIHTLIHTYKLFITFYILYVERYVP